MLESLGFSMYTCGVCQNHSPALGPYYSGYITLNKGHGFGYYPMLRIPLYVREGGSVRAWGGA